MPNSVIFQETFSPQKPLPSTRPLVLFGLMEWEKKAFFDDNTLRFENAKTVFLNDEEIASPERFQERLIDLNPSVLVSGWSTPPLPPDWAADPRCPLLYVSHITGSIRHVVPRSFLERGGIATNWGDIAAPDVAEHALLLALATLRNVNAWRPCVEAREHGYVNAANFIGTRSLHGRRVGVHGFGRIARALLKLLRPFNVQAAAFSEGVPRDVFLKEGVKPCDSLRELFEGSDILFECEALTPKTEGSVDASALGFLPDESVFVNVGRGRVVDEIALLGEAVSGRLRVALDVVAEEPLRKQSDFFDLPNVLLSPHIGGPTLDHYRECGTQALRNIALFLQDTAPEAIVTLGAYDLST